MTISVVGVNGILPFEPEGHPPVSADPHRPHALPFPFERMQLITGQIHILWMSGGVKSVEDAAQFRRLLLVDLADVSGLEITFQTFVFE